MRVSDKYWLGIGCKRGVTEKNIADAVILALKTTSVDEQCIVGVASIDVKRSELGLHSYILNQGLDSKYFSSEELKCIQVPNPSKNPMKAVGTPSVAEAAAILASNGKLIIEKQKLNGVTVALAKCSK